MRLPSPVSVGRGALRELGRAMVFVGVMCASVSAMAQQQYNADRILATVIRGLQTGQINQSWFGQQLLQTIHQQTNGSFVYPKLVELGAVQNIQVTGQQPVAQGVIYALRVTHANGGTEWQMGISHQTNRIEYLAVNVTDARTAPPSPPSPPPSRPAPTADPQLKPLPFPDRGEPPSSQPQPPPSQPQPPPQRQPPVAGPPTMPTPSPAQPAGGTGGSEACRLYPNLC